MQALQPSISGTRDYAGEDAVALQAARDAIASTLRGYAYAAIDPPILESSLPFLNRSGEDIRRRMYIFPDPAGREVCLRPELTIPVCRAYLRQTQSAAAAGSRTAQRQARLCYFGPAFTYEAATEGHYRQFYQAGAEFLGGVDREAADAEILAAALDALEAAGLADTNVEFGDVEVRNTFIDRLPIGDQAKARIRRLALRNRQDLRQATAVFTQTAAESERTNGFGELASLLASVEPGKAALLIREVFALADVRHVGGRTAEEIAERLISRATQDAEPISPELMQGVTELLNIRAKPEAAFKTIREHFRSFGLGSIDPILERCETRLRYVQAYRRRAPAARFNVGLRRDLEFYTGFVFEIYAKDTPQIGHVCGGGRYDNLLEGLGANVPIPAVGFGIGLDRLLLALQKTPQRGLRDAASPQALVVGSGGKHEECIRAAAALRGSGWSVELSADQSDETGALRDAAGRGIAYVVFVGGDRTKTGQARVKRLRDCTERQVAIDSLPAYAASEGAQAPASKKQ